jgi:hypothetical protein
MIKKKENLNEFHKKVDIFSVEFSRKILDSLIKHRSQRVLFSSY